MFEAVGDLVITASIVYHLKRAKSPFPQTNKYRRSRHSVFLSFLIPPFPFSPSFIDKILRSSMENNPASGVAAFVRIRLPGPRLGAPPHFTFRVQIDSIVFLATPTYWYVRIFSGVCSQCLMLFSPTGTSYSTGWSRRSSKSGPLRLSHTALANQR